MHLYFIDTKFLLINARVGGINRQLGTIPQPCNHIPKLSKIIFSGSA